MKILLLLALASGQALTTRSPVACLDSGTFSIEINGVPNANTGAFVQTLREMNQTALFNVDVQRLGMGGIPTMLQSIAKNNHILGLSLLSENLNSMSREGRQGILADYSDQFEKILGNRPRLLRVALDTEDDVLEELRRAGYLVIFPSLDLHSAFRGTCASKIDFTGLEKSSKPSVVLGLTDSQDGCTAAELKSIIGQLESIGYKAHRLDKCIGLADPYIVKSDNEPVTLYDLPSRGTSSLNGTGKADGQSNNGRSVFTKLSWMLILAMGLAFII